MIKKRLIKSLCMIIIVVLFTVVFNKAINYNQSFDIRVKKVNEINSELYELVTFYEYNSINNQFKVSSKYIHKEFVILEIFNYYNEELIYYISEYDINDDCLTIVLKNDTIDMMTFKKMKLSYKSINIDQLIIKYNGIIKQI